MKRLLVVVLTCLLIACQTVPPSDFSRQQREVLAQAGFVQVGENYELGLEDRLLFDIDRSEVKAIQRERLAMLSAALVAVEIRGARVEGHTDATGTVQHNLSLARSRAEAVKQVLVQGGLAAGRVNTQALGEADPIASNSTSAGREQNRRVVLVIRPVDLRPL